MEEFTNVLPPDFDGVFRFTNWSEEDFTGKWAKKEYLYPALRTTPMFIESATPLETQNIRKKFARDLAEREFHKSEKGKQLTSDERNPDGSARFNSFQQARQYSLDDLKEGIQRCLEALPTASAIVSDSKMPDITTLLSRDEDGEINTQVVRNKEPLKTKNKDR